MGIQGSMLHIACIGLVKQKLLDCLATLLGPVCNIRLGHHLPWTTALTRLGMTPQGVGRCLVRDGNPFSHEGFMQVVQGVRQGIAMVSAPFKLMPDHAQSDCFKGVGHGRLCHASEILAFGMGAFIMNLLHNHI